MIIEKNAEVDTAFRAAGCFCICKEEVLIIQRQRDKPFQLHWAIPTGKIESGESPSECMARELREELGLRVDPTHLEELSDFIIEHDSITFEYVAFVLHLDHQPDLRPKVDEVRKVEWVPVNNISKRRVVPYFYNTVQSLLDRVHHNAIQQRLFPASEASSAKRRPA